MVYVNSKKFACESCIKGHRSSSCHHTDRPLFEIKKKGRPVSQCVKCRELRQSKKFHSKCTCNHGVEVPAVQPLASSSNSKTRRYIPIVPALPNGLKDVLTASRTPMRPSDARQRVDSLLNPCECKSLWKCRCRERPRSAVSSSPTAPDGLDTLAIAAASASMGCCTPSTSSLVASSLSPVASPSVRTCSPRVRARPESPSSQNASKKRAKPNPLLQASPGPDLAPLLYLSSPSSPSISTAMPEFPSMPPMSEITSLAGSGCTCGVKCACPGCVEHRPPTKAAQERRDCADGCGACIDSTIGAALPNLSGVDSQSGSVSFLDRFFARAAALPPPPVNRKMSFDPMDTTVYAHVVGGSRAFPFGSVNLPKLECCGGQCKCPDERCCCQQSCAGCCAEPSQAKESADETLRSNVSHGHVTARQVPRGCCA